MLPSVGYLQIWCQIVREILCSQIAWRYNVFICANVFIAWEFFLLISNSFKICKIAVFIQILADILSQCQTIWISDKAPHYVGPHLDLNCLQRSDFNQNPALAGKALILFLCAFKIGHRHRFHLSVQEYSEFVLQSKNNTSKLFVFRLYFGLL